MTLLQLSSLKEVGSQSIVKIVVVMRILYLQLLAQVIIFVEILDDILSPK